MPVRVDREGQYLLGIAARDLLDVHAALGRHHEGNARAFPVDQRGEIELLLDGRAFLDVEPVDLLAVRAGLVGHERRAEQALGFLLHVVDRLHHLDAAGLAAAAGMDLRLHHQHRQREVARGLHRLLDREGGMTARHRHAELAQHRLGLILVDVHYLPRFGAIFRQASTRVATDSADFSNMVRSAPLSWISTIRSTPLEPITAGTPT